MANTITATYSFTLPEVGGDTNAWGGHLNGNFSIIDAQMVSRTLTTAQTLASAINLPSNGLNVGSGQLSVTGGNVSMSGNASAVNGSFSGTLSAGGNVTLSGNLSVTNAVTLSSTLAVTGAATFSSTGSFSGNVTASTAPTVGDHLTNKTYVDAQATSAQTAAVALACPAGAVMAFARNTAPTGWLAANGAVVSRTAYAALFAAIGTTFNTGGEAATDFRLPDMRGYFVRGSGTNTDGTTSGTFGAKQADDVKPHNHGVTDPGHVHTMGVYNQPAAGAGATGSNVILLGAALSTASATTGITINNSTGTETRPKNIALLYCIKT